MKRFLLISFILFSFTVSLAAQTPCPTIPVSGPTEITMLGEEIIFTASVSTKLETYRYHWTVSGGKIMKGQGTTRISVVQEKIVPTLTATLEISGLPSGCANSASATGEFILDPIARQIDGFSVSPNRIRKDKLAAIGIELKEDQYSQFYILENFKRNTSPATINRKLKLTYSFLSKTLKLDISRITISVSESERTTTEFWVIPLGTDYPNGGGQVTIFANKNYLKSIDEAFPIIKAKPHKRRVAF